MEIPFVYILIPILLGIIGTSQSIRGIIHNEGLDPKVVVIVHSDSTSWKVASSIAPPCEVQMQRMHLVSKSVVKA